jgi:hypothetical protein
MLSGMGTARLCSVSFRDHSGVQHHAQVTAESLYEAAVLGIHVISQEWAEEPGPMTAIEVQVQLPTVRHEVTWKQVREWLTATCKTPKERALKERLKVLTA